MSLHVDRRGDGPDLVLLHGWGMHGGVWEPVADALARRYRLHAVDLPGHGHSAATPLRGLDAAVEAVAELTPDGAIVCGWSLGGLVAQRLAHCFPAKVRALALASATPCFVERPDWRSAMKVETLGAFAADLRRDLAGTLKTFLALNALGGAASRAAMRALAAQLAARGAPDASALDAGLALLRDSDLRATAPAITQPSVVIHGRRDALTPIAAGRWLATTLPYASLYELEDGAHLPFATHPGIFVRALEALHG